MGDTLITMIVDDKQAMLECLLETQRQGMEYTDECLKVLADKYHADMSKVDRQEFSYGPTGYILECGALEKDVMPPEEYLAERLSHYSNHGLAFCGLTREQYEQTVQLTMPCTATSPAPQGVS